MRHVYKVEFFLQFFIKVYLLFLIPSSLLSQAQDIEIDTPKKVIVDCDLCVGVDDVGALAMLHAMADQGEVEILAICYNEVHPMGIVAIDAINTWYNRGNIPIGQFKDTLAEPDESEYLNYLEKYSHDINRGSVQSACELYLKVLKNHEDQSITIISLGFLNNLYNLLVNNPQLVSSKIKELVIMGGVVNDGFNLSHHNLVSQSEYVINNWPTPIVFSQSGTHIITGTEFKNSKPNNPIHEAYYRMHSPYFNIHSSWDQVAVLYAVRGLNGYFKLVEEGNGKLTNGYEWSMKPDYRTYIEPIVSIRVLSSIIDDLMMKSPKNTDKD
jgi:hypothetical protein